jgi:hypothetical protein
MHGLGVLRRIIPGACVHQDRRHTACLYTGWHKVHSCFGAANNFAVDTNEDSSAFTTANLSNYGTIVFPNPSVGASGTFLTAAQEQAFVDYFAAGGGWVGLHCAASCETNWAE